MKKSRKLFACLTFTALIFYGFVTFMESSAWARAGRGGSFGSRGSRSFSTPRTPSSPSPSSPGMSTPGSGPLSGPSGQPSTGFFGRSPFLQGMAGGLAGGLLGSMLFGGSSHAAPGAATGGGIGFLDIIIIGALLYFGWKYFKRKREQALATGYYDQGGTSMAQQYPDQQSYYRDSQSERYLSASGPDNGIQELRRMDPSLNEEALKETFQDMFFRIQAAWMNRSLAGIEGMVASEMAGFFNAEFEQLRQRGQINRLENIAVRKVEISEAWQETGMDYVTVLFTANLLDYTVDDTTGQVVGGDKNNPVKFQEFWTFNREIGSTQWKLTAINQTGEAIARVN